MKIILNYIYPYIINILVTGVALWGSFVIVVIGGLLQILGWKILHNLGNELEIILTIEIFISILINYFILKRNKKIYKQQILECKENATILRRLYILQGVIIVLATVILVIWLIGSIGLDEYWINHLRANS